LKKHEIESLIKSFLLFFISQGLFLTLIFYLDYQQKVLDLQQHVFTKIRLCSYDLACPEYKIDFKPKKDRKELFLYEVPEGLEVYFPVPNSKEYFMSLTYPMESYEKKKREIVKVGSYKFLFLLFIVAFLSLLFSFYALYPMKRALGTIEEFIKDILHDFNTPISSIVLNSSLLKKDKVNEEKVFRIQKSTENILALQENLKACLLNLQSQKEEFEVTRLIERKKASLQKIYPQIVWKLDRTPLYLTTNKNAFDRIISNILSNAAKYNGHEWRITTTIDSEKKTLTIEDTGVGIKNPEKVFNRFYTEDAHGTGIGLHIVKKLCDELGIKIEVISKRQECSCFILHLGALTQ
jgi:two-component sensor histidine kinase